MKRKNSIAVKLIILASGICMFHLSVSGQTTTQKNTVQKSVESVNESTRKISEQSLEISQQAGQISVNIQQAIENAKTAVKVFEPILKLRLRKKAEPSADTQGQVDIWQVPPPIPLQGNYDSLQQQVLQQQYNQYDQYQVNPIDLNNTSNIITQSTTYNSDGTANLGNQNSKKYGCYINILSGSIMDEIDAAGNSTSIDLIFTSTDHFNSQVPMYAFLTPSFTKNDAFAYNFFKGTKYKDQNIPPKLWDEVNESEVALTSLTGEQFERIQTNQQLMAVVKQVPGFSQKVESRTKLDGKVLAIKTEMGSRTAYGLLYIVSHMGTFGENAYLKIKIKVSGLDATGDGNPDPGLYQ